MAPKSARRSADASYDLETVRMAASGRAVEVLERVAGIPRNALTAKHGPCPKCGGNDRFRLLDESAGAVYCNQCFDQRNGDFFSAIQWYLGVGFQESLKLAAEYLNVRPEAKKKKREEGRANRPR